MTTPVFPTWAGSVLAVQTTTTAHCSDCPTPPEGVLGWFSALFFLTVIPGSALALGFYAYAGLRTAFAQQSIRQARLECGLMAGLMAVLAADHAPVIGGLVTTVRMGFLPDASLLFVAVCIGGFALLGDRLPGTVPGAVGVALLALVLSWGLVGVGTDFEQGMRTVDIMALLAVVPLAYPLGVQFGSTGDSDRWWFFAIVAGMFLGTQVMMWQFFPMRQGLGGLIYPVMFVVVLAELLVATPLVGLGYTTADDRT